jgi:carotenoid cleavage dioxygenase
MALLSPDEQQLTVRGRVPRELVGALLQAHPHPGLCSRRHPESTPLAVSGVRFRRGEVSWYQAGAGRRPCPFGPVAALDVPVRLAGLPRLAEGQGTAAWPMRDPVSKHWHTVVTYADRKYADHLLVADGGAVLRTQRFALDQAPLMHTVAVTERYLVVFDLPVTYRRAAALVGERTPYSWQADRRARIGLLPRDADGDVTPRWFDVDPGYTFRTVNAYDDGERVVVDALWHEGAPEDLATQGPAPVVRWTLDLRTGTARSHALTDEVRVAVADPSVAGRQHRFLFSANGNTIARHDLRTGRTGTHDFGAGRRPGQPVLVSGVEVGAEGGGWVMAFVEDVAERSATAFVFDATDVAGEPVAEIPLPACVPTSPRATWVPAGPARSKEMR